ncbi:MAG: class I SAM-dependent methyltransferase [Proteobacteria bacterium]|nr:class I SAM-dependent methyltransferase [Pseudomonadota bacterium]
MFYGSFSKEQRDKFSRSLDLFVEMFDVMHAYDNLIALRRTTGFKYDATFRAAFDPNVSDKQEKSLMWRIHTLIWAAEHCINVEGDFVECSVLRGFSMAIVADFLRFERLDRQMYLYDTYTGTPPEYNSENRNLAAYVKMGDLYDYVLERFNRYSNIHPIKGTVPDSFTGTLPDKISFCHIDMNSAKSEIAALEHIFDRVTPGGIIVFDDYGWVDYKAQKDAEDAFMAERGHTILESPTGQGILIKHA